MSVCHQLSREFSICLPGFLASPHRSLQSESGLQSTQRPVKKPLIRDEAPEIEQSVPRVMKVGRELPIAGPGGVGSD